MARKKDRNNKGHPPIKNVHACELSKLGARKGGIARAKSMTEQQRSNSARKAANARWKKYRRERGIDI